MPMVSRLAQLTVIDVLATDLLCVAGQNSDNLKRTRKRLLNRVLIKNYHQSDDR